MYKNTEALNHHTGSHSCTHSHFRDFPLSLMITANRGSLSFAKFSKPSQIAVYLCVLATLNVAI